MERLHRLTCNFCYTLYTNPFDDTAFLPEGSFDRYDIRTQAFTRTTWIERVIARCMGYIDGYTDVGITVHMPLSLQKYIEPDRNHFYACVFEFNSPFLFLFSRKNVLCFFAQWKFPGTDFPRRYWFLFVENLATSIIVITDFWSVLLPHSFHVSTSFLADYQWRIQLSRI